MALTYTFYSDRDFDGAALLKAVEGAKIRTKAGRSFIDTATITLGSDSKASIMEAFGIQPRVAILFRLDKFAEADLAFEQLIQACLTLIDLGAGNALLLFQGEIPVFLYQDNQLNLNSAREFWKHSDRVKLLDRPFELKIIPNLD